MSDIQVLGERSPGYESILSDDALAFVADLHVRFDPRRRQLLADRDARQSNLDRGMVYEFLDETESVRCGQWTVSPVNDDLQDRRCEITGPTDRKMVINALNSGAKVFMTDFEDSNSPTWANMVEGQINLFDAIRRQVDFTADTGKRYELADDAATLMVRPRGWHLDESNVAIRRASGLGFAFRFRFVLLPQRGGAGLSWIGTVLLPPEAREPSGSPVVERGVRPRAASARDRARDNQGDRIDRDNSGCL